MNRQAVRKSRKTAEVFARNAKERKCLPEFLILRIFLLDAFEMPIMCVELSLASCACVNSILFSTLRIEGQYHKVIAYEYTVCYNKKNKENLK